VNVNTLSKDDSELCSACIHTAHHPHESQNGMRLPYVDFTKIILHIYTASEISPVFKFGAVFYKPQTVCSQFTLSVAVTNVTL